MKTILTEEAEAVELQQCTHDPNSHSTSTPLGPPRTSKSTLSRTILGAHNSPAMASQPDSAFAEDDDIDQELRSRLSASNSKSKVLLYMPNRSGSTPPASESDNEDAPLLSPRNDYGSVDGDGSGDSEEAWPGEADFRGLPWWKRPSVGMQKLGT